MNGKERLELHRRLGEGMIDAFTHCVERGRVEFPAEFEFSEDAVVWAPMLYGSKEHSVGAELGDGRTQSDRNTAEFRTYWKVMPDFRLVAHGEPFVTEEGFSEWFRFEGTAGDGRTLGFYEADFFRTDGEGRVSRVESFHDVEGMADVLELLGVESGAGWETLRRLRE